MLSVLAYIGLGVAGLVLLAIVALVVAAIRANRGQTTAVIDEWIKRHPETYRTVLMARFAAKQRALAQQFDRIVAGQLDALEVLREFADFSDELSFAEYEQWIESMRLQAQSCRRVADFLAGAIQERSN